MKGFGDITMGKLSVKFKITLWYTIIMIIISFAVLVAMTSLSAGLLKRNISERMINTADSFAREVEISRDIINIPKFKFYNRSVHMVLLDDSFNVAGGQIPFGISDEMSCTDNGVRVESHNGNDYYVFDRRVLRRDGSVYWIKSFVSASDTVNSINSVAKNNAMLIIVMIIAASAGGYIIIGKILTPVNKIRRTAEEISESNDLSQRISLPDGNDEFHKLAASFDKMLDKIEQTVEREKQFTSDVSHELRTPVAAILSSCEYMTGYAKTYEDIKESAEGVKKEAERMSKLISELLTISRMDKNTIQLSFEDVDFGELLNFVCDEQAEIHDDNITLSRNIGENIIVKADRFMLARLCINLISNAYSYGKDNGNITVTLTCDSDNAVMSVSDDGIGIAEENIPKIWERFYQVDPSRTIDDKGNMGLGLSMVKWIAECHKGNMTVKSTLGKGSTFTFTMPVC